MTYGAVQQMALVETYVDSDGVIKVRDSFRLTPSFGAVFYQSMDIGFPQVRASSQDNPQADGTYDETQFLGARTVSITGLVLNNAFHELPAAGGWDTSVGWNSASWFTRYLSGWASPARRSRLYFTDDSGLSRFVDVRGDSFSAPVDKSSANSRTWQLGFINPSGKIYSFKSGSDASIDGKSRQLIRQTSINVTGRTYPEIGPYLRSYPPPPSGATAVDYEGTVSNGFIANVYTVAEPMRDPRITVTAPDGTVQSIGITGYEIPAGEVVTFDTTERTITTSSGVSLDEFKTAPLQWPQLRPGRATGQTSGHNAIGFTVASSAANAFLEVLYYSADLA